MAVVEDSLRILLGSFPGIVWTTDDDLRLTALFGADLERLGVRAEDIVGKTIPEYFRVEDDDHPVAAAHLRALAGESATYEQLVERQPRRGWIEPQKAVRESEALTRAVVEAALDAVVIINSVGRVIEFNPAAEETFGYARNDVIGREMVDLIIPPALRDAHRAGFDRYLRTGESKILGKRLELSAVRADGSEFPAELTITRVPLGGEPVFAGYIRDVTEQHTLEEQLRQSQKMEAIGSLAGGIAHDFNNILMIIRSCSALALRKEPDDDVRRNIAQIDGAAERAASLTHQLLAFSRQQLLRPEVTDVNDTTFKLYFPSAGAQTPALQDAQALAPAARGTETILLAEDEEQVRELIARSLRLDGYTVLEARNGLEAVELARDQETIDLLLTDVVMPGLNGRELWERLSAERPSLRVLFTSGYPADTVLRHGIAEGRVAYIEKPYLPSELARFAKF